MKWKQLGSLYRRLKTMKEGRLKEGGEGGIRQELHILFYWTYERNYLLSNENMYLHSSRYIKITRCIP